MTKFGLIGATADAIGTLIFSPPSRNYYWMNKGPKTTVPGQINYLALSLPVA
jgi:hypothetical protein